MAHPAQHLKKHQLRPQKKLGQHFLKDPVLAFKIVELAAIKPQDTVLEIGPGLGALTRFLAQKAGRVVAVEIDPHLCAFLEKELADLENVQVLNMDFLKLGPREFKEWSERKIRVVGNLPYNITSPVLFKLMDNAPLMGEAVLMVQREVADRLLAAPGNRLYGLTTVLVGYYAQVRLLMEVPPQAFHPRPKVGSTLIGVDFTRPHPRRAANEAALRRTVKAAFALRRKMLKNALLKAPGLGADQQEINRVLGLAGIDPRARAETLSLDQYITLSDLLNP